MRRALRILLARCEARIFRSLARLGIRRRGRKRPRQATGRPQSYRSGIRAKALKAFRDGSVHKITINDTGRRIAVHAAVSFVGDPLINLESDEVPQVYKWDLIDIEKL